MKNIVMAVPFLFFLVCPVLLVSAGPGGGTGPDCGLLSAALNVDTEAGYNRLLGTVEAGAYRDLYLGIGLHNLCQGDPERQEEAEARLSAVLEQTGAPLAMGYLGSVITIRAGSASRRGNFVEATAALSRGIQMMDDAVAADPDSVALRFLRIFNGFDVSESSPVSRIDLVRRDITWLEGGAGPGLQGPEEEALLLFAKGRLALLDEDYNQTFRYLEAVLTKAPGSQAAKQADDLLWFLEE